MTPPIRHLGILAGLQSEARCISPFMPEDCRQFVTVTLSGARAEGAKAASARLIATGASHLLSFGLAGGLDPALGPGTLLVPDRLILPDRTVKSVDAAWHAELLDLLGDLSPAIGNHLGSDRAIGSAAEKSALFAETGALAVDMESHIMAAAAAEAGLPFALLRVVCDAADDNLPPAALAAIRPDGSTDLLAVLGSVLARPSQIPALGRLAQSSKAAERVLRTCGRLLPQMVSQPAVGGEAEARLS